MINAQIAAQRLKKLRVDKGLSHQKLSEALSDFGVDVSPRSLMNYESAAKDEFHSKSQSISKMNASTLVALAEFFDVSTDYLLGLNDAPTADIEVQAITDYTGLSVESVKILHKHKFYQRYAAYGRFGNTVSIEDEKGKVIEYFTLDMYLLLALNILIEKFSNTDFFENFMNYLYSDDLHVVNFLDTQHFDIKPYERILHNIIADVIETNHVIIDNHPINDIKDIFTNSIYLSNDKLGNNTKPFTINNTTTEAVSMLMLQQTLKRIKDQLHDSPDE